MLLALWLGIQHSKPHPFAVAWQCESTMLPLQWWPNTRVCGGQSAQLHGFKVNNSSNRGELAQAAQKQEQKQQEQEQKQQELEQKQQMPQSPK